MKTYPLFIFEKGDKVIWTHSEKHLSGVEGIVTERKRVVHHLLSEINRTKVVVCQYNVSVDYSNKSRKTAMRYNDDELMLVSSDVIKPQGAVDYSSDEYTADYLDKNGIVLKTVKAGRAGLAHRIVSANFNLHK